MRIGIDIDDVITDTSRAAKKYIDEYDKDSDIHKYIEDIMRGDMPTKEVELFFKNNALKIFESAVIKEDAKETISEWLKNGHEIYLITARGETIMKGTEEITLNYLKDNNINYTRILFNAYEKVQVCKDNKIDVLIDDSVKYCDEAQIKGINSILFTSVVNRTIHSNSQRVSNWIELKEKINNLINK